MKNNEEKIIKDEKIIIDKSTISNSIIGHGNEKNKIKSKSIYVTKKEASIIVGVLTAVIAGIILHLIFGN